MGTMSDQKTHPYTLEVTPSQTKPGQFQWAIRLYGKLHQRSDRLLGSEKAAHKDGMAQIDRMLQGLDERR